MLDRVTMWRARATVSRPPILAMLTSLKIKFRILKYIGYDLVFLNQIFGYIRAIYGDPIDDFWTYDGPNNALNGHAKNVLKNYSSGCQRAKNHIFTFFAITQSFIKIPS